MATKFVIALLLCLTPALGWAQSTTIVGTCDQYQPGAGGDFCINTGAATYWQQFTGDVVNTRNVPQCSPTNTTACGKLTVQGINGVPLNGTLADGQTWCYQASSNTMIPCAP